MKSVQEREVFMTEGQTRYQTLVENQRHNMAMERFTGEQVDVAKKQNELKERQVYLEEEYQPFKIAETSTKTAGQEFKNKEEKHNFFTGVFKNIGESLMGIAERNISIGSHILKALFK